MRPRFLRSLLPVLVLAALPAVSHAGVYLGVSVNVPPPALPVYVQPPCPQPGYIWVPGYWAWGPYGYYWVPGTWVLPPEVGLLWTPGWWGWDADGDDYRWHAGYWGPRVGFYGGIDYGFGYDGVGFVGGFWRGGVFFYNRAVVRVGPGFDRNVYYHHVYRPEDRHISFNGGRYGIRARPTQWDMRAVRERRYGFTRMQRRHENMARGERVLRASFNHGRPPIAATARPVVFHGHGVYGARAAGGPMRFRDHAPVRQRAPMRQLRSDRPPWATGQSRMRNQTFQGNVRQRRYSAPGGARPQFQGQRFQRPQTRAPQRYQPQAPRGQGSQRFQGRPMQHSYQPHGNWTVQRPQAASRYQQRFQRPQAASRYQQRFQRPQTALRYQQRFQRPQAAPRYQQRFQRPQAAPRYQQRFQRPQAAPRYQQRFQRPQAGPRGGEPARRQAQRRPPENRGGGPGHRR